MSTRTEYLDPLPATNGNGHANGNGHKKVFELAPVKTPEEAEREIVKDIAPKIRRYVRSDPNLTGGAKFFFDALLDDSFMYQFGGTGRGVLYVSIADLATRYHHDEKTIKAWRDELVERRWIWYQKGWPFPEWRITNLCPAPEDKSDNQAVQMVLGRAEAARQKGNFSGEGFLDHSESKPQQIPDSQPDFSGSNRENFPEQPGIFPGVNRKISPSLGGEIPVCDRKDSGLLRDTSTRVNGKISRSEPEILPAKSDKPTRPPASNGGLEKSPRSGEEGVIEKGGGPPPKKGSWEAEFAKWEFGLTKLFHRELRPILEDLEGEKTKIKEFDAPSPARTEKLARLKQKITAVKSKLNGPE